MTSRFQIILSVLAVTAILSAPAQARHYRSAPHFGRSSPLLDVAAIAPYPTKQASRTAYRLSRAASHSAERRRMAHGSREAVLARPEPRQGESGLVTVDTAAGIRITVARAFASKIEGFVADLVARGYHPRQIHCYANGGHVRHSLHYSGHACDFDQRGWGLTARPMYHVADLVRKWDLRDGGEFRDWGHIDDGQHLSRSRRIAAIMAQPFYGPTSLSKDHHHHRMHYARK